MEPNNHGIACTVDKLSSVEFSDDLQSWSTNEVELSNITVEIEEALEDQRALVAQEMKGYTYPAGKYNISVRWVDITSYFCIVSYSQNVFLSKIILAYIP